MKKNNRLFLDDGSIYQILNLGRTYADPRTMPAISLMLGYNISLRQLQEVKWTDLNLGSYTALIRDPKGGPSRSVQLTRLLIQQLIPVVRQKVRASRPFGKASASAPTIGQLLQSVLVRARLVNYTPTDLVAWSLSKSEAIRASVVTACVY